MLLTVMGHSSFNRGRYAGYLSGGPNYCQRFKRYRYPRLVYHSGLDKLVVYPQVPTRTLNFSFDLLPRVDYVESKTLTANLTQRWSPVYHDVIVKEYFEGDLSQRWSFMHDLYEMYTTIQDAGGYMLWRPLDLTDKIYRVTIVNMLLDGEEFNPTYVGINQPDKWMTSALEVWYKITPAFAPSCSIFASGGLSTGSL